MPNLLPVMIGGAIGAALRYEVGRVALHRIGAGFPWGTLIVNLVGGLLMGVLAGYMFTRNPPDQNLWLFVGVGLLGGFTTFSAFSFDLFSMLERGQMGIAAAYAGVSVAGSVILLFAGFWLARMAT
jgi:CrcB protein